MNISRLRGNALAIDNHLVIPSTINTWAKLGCALPVEHIFQRRAFESRNDRRLREATRSPDSGSMSGLRPDYHPDCGANKL